jgi:acetyl esterase/lipase
MLFALMALLAVGCEEQAGADASSAGGAAADSIIDAQYCPGHDARRMDVFLPHDSFPSPRPVVVYVHGGAWTEGDKGYVDEHLLYSPVKTRLLRRGYVFVTVNYRLAKDGAGGDALTAFPTQVEDVTCAIGHLRGDARRYRIDGRRIALWGFSAGAHVAALAGTLPRGMHEGHGGDAGTPSDVRALLLQSAITDLGRPRDFTGMESYLERAFPGYAERQGSVARQASPLTYADTSDPPFFLLHGGRDQYVSAGQSIRLHARLGGNREGHRLSVVPGAFHSFSGTSQRVLDDLADSMVAFVDAHLGG